MYITVTHLEMIGERLSASDVERRGASSCNRNSSVVWGRLEGSRARQALVEPRKVDLPGNVNAIGILFPMTIHLLGIVRICPRGERVMGRGGLGSGVAASDG